MPFVFHGLSEPGVGRGDWSIVPPKAPSDVLPAPRHSSVEQLVLAVTVHLRAG